MEDKKTGNDLACAAALKMYRIKTTISALGEKEKKSGLAKKLQSKAEKEITIDEANVPMFSDATYEHLHIKKEGLEEQGFEVGE